MGGGTAPDTFWSFDVSAMMTNRSLARTSSATRSPGAIQSLVKWWLFASLVTDIIYFSGRPDRSREPPGAVGLVQSWENRARRGSESCASMGVPLRPLAAPVRARRGDAALRVHHSYSTPIPYAFLRRLPLSSLQRLHPGHRGPSSSLSWVSSYLSSIPSSECLCLER